MRHLAAIVETTNDAILSKTLGGTILTWNRGAELLYGYAAEEAVGRAAGMLATDITVVVPVGAPGTLVSLTF